MDLSSSAALTESDGPSIGGGWSCPVLASLAEGKAIKVDGGGGGGDVVMVTVPGERHIHIPDPGNCICTLRIQQHTELGRTV